MKKNLIIFSSILTITPMIGTVVSCSSTPDHKVMNFKVDENKVKALTISDFNALPNDETKMLQIIAQSATQVDRYTKEALQENLFKKINIKDESTRFVVEFEIETKKGDKHFSYRLPNGSTSQNIIVQKSK